jgi:hypothetical protein
MRLEKDTPSSASTPASRALLPTNQHSHHVDVFRYLRFLRLRRDHRDRQGRLQGRQSHHLPLHELQEARRLS